MLFWYKLSLKLQNLMRRVSIRNIYIKYLRKPLSRRTCLENFFIVTKNKQRQILKYCQLPHFYYHKFSSTNLLKLQVWSVKYCDRGVCRPYS